MRISTIQTNAVGKTDTGNLPSTGFSLVELMITIAIISILTTIAIPLYNGYIREGHLATMRTTMNGLRTILEDYRLENGDYGPVTDYVGVGNIQAEFAWDPSGDSSPYTYTVAVTSASQYGVIGTYNANTEIWVRCDRRFANCCDPDSGTDATTACPP